MTTMALKAERHDRSAVQPKQLKELALWEDLEKQNVDAAEELMIYKVTMWEALAR